MEAILILTVAMVVILIAGYYLLILLVNLLKSLTQHFQGALKSVFVIAGIVGLLWVLDNKENAPLIIDHVKAWMTDPKHIELFDLGNE